MWNMTPRFAGCPIHSHGAAIQKTRLLDCFAERQAASHGHIFHKITIIIESTGSSRSWESRKEAENPPQIND